MQCCKLQVRRVSNSRALKLYNMPITLKLIWELNHAKLTIHTNFQLLAVMWKRTQKLEAEAPEAAIFYGSGSESGKHEMNGSGSCKKILEAEAEAEAIQNSPLPHYWLEPPLSQNKRLCTISNDRV